MSEKEHIREYLKNEFWQLVVGKEINYNTKYETV